MDSKNPKENELKKMIPQLLVSLSLFSFLFSYSSSYHSLLHKNTLFLICNALLVFLAKTSGFIRPPDLDDLMHKSITDTLQTALEKYVLEHVAVHNKTTKEEEKEDKSTSSTAEEVSIFIAESEEEELVQHPDFQDHKDENHQLDSNRCWLFDDDDEDQADEHEDEDEEMSTEELNQKVEDFIRRMKEEIIINEEAARVTRKMKKTVMLK